MDREHHDVAAALLVDDGRVLLCHRHPNRRWYPNVWDIPGGHIGIGETPAAALRRELREELGVEIRLVDEEPWMSLAPSSDLTLKVWMVEHWDGNVENHALEEHDQIAWFTPDEVGKLALADDHLEDLIHQATRR